MRPALRPTRQRNADVTVEHAQLRIVARDHDGPARIPFAAAADGALRFQGLLHRPVEAGHAPVPLAHGAQQPEALEGLQHIDHPDRKSTRLNSSHLVISYAVFCLKKKKNNSSHMYSAT